jgi:hypothetical protein
MGDKYISGREKRKLKYDKEQDTSGRSSMIWSLEGMDLCQAGLIVMGL